MAKALITEDFLSRIGDAIRGKLGISDMMKPEVMAKKIEEIPVGDGIDRLVSGTLESFTDSSITSVKDYAFSSCTSMTSIELKSAVSIGNYAFSGCSTLSELLLPAARDIGTSAFASCYGLRSISLPSVTSVGANAFSSCGNLDQVSLPMALSIGSNAFQNCSSLTDLDFPKVTKVNNWAFAYCSNLKTLKLPALESLSTYSYVLGNVTGIEYVVFGIETFSDGWDGVTRFTVNSKLTRLDFPNCKSITKATAFATNYLPNLAELHFGAANQSTIEALNGYDTKFGATNATIYFDL